MPKLTPKVVKQRLKVIRMKQHELTCEAAKIKAQCSHVGEIDYCQDPSGNNDSSYDCRACGASWRHWPKDVPT
jgi:hypothetical protein